MSGSSTFSSPNMDAPANNLPTSPSPSTLMDLPPSQELQDGNSVTVNENVECDDFEVDSFLLTALSNPRDRLTLLKLDTDLEKFIKDPRKTRQEFPPMSSYQRLIVHRVAQYFKLDHVVVEAEPGKRAVVLYKTSASRVPIIRLVDLVEQPETSNNNTKAVKIMRRSNGNSNNNERSVPTKPVIMEDSNKPPVLSNPTREDIKILQNPTFLPPQPEQNYNNNPDGKSDRSLEEREVNYAKARARIFGISEDTPLPEQPQQPIQPPPQQVMPPPSATIPTPSSDPSKDSSTNGNSSTSRKPRNTVHMKYNEPLQDAHEYSRNLDDWRSSNAVPPNYMWAQPIAPVSAMNVPTAVPINYFDIQPQMNGSYQQRAPTGYPVATPHPTWDEFSNAYRMAYPSPYYPPMVSPHHFPPLPQYQQPQQPLRKSPQTSHKSTDPSRPPTKTTQYYAPVQTTKKPQQFSSQYPPQQYPPTNPKSESSSTDQTSPTMTHKPSTTLPSSQPFVPRGYPQTYEDMWGYSQGAFRSYPTYPIDPSNQDKKLAKKEPPPPSVQFQQNPQFRSSSPSMSKVEQPPNDSSSLSSVVDDTSSHVPRSPSHDSFFSIPSSTPNSQLTPSTTQQPLYNTPQISNPATIVQDSTQMKTGPTLLSHILEIGNMKTTTMNTPEADSFLEELKQQGGLIKCLDNGTILVVFRSVGIASKAVQSIQQTCYSLKPWKVQVTNVVIGESSNTTPSTNPVDSLGNSVESLNIS